MGRVTFTKELLQFVLKWCLMMYAVFYFGYYNEHYVAEYFLMFFPLALNMVLLREKEFEMEAKRCSVFNHWRAS